MITLVEEYTDRLISDRKRPNPQKVLDRISNSTKREDLKAHLNTATLLTTLGLAQRKRAQTILRNKKRIDAAKQRLVQSLSKNGGGAQ